MREPFDRPQRVLRFGVTLGPKKPLDNALGWAVLGRPPYRPAPGAKPAQALVSGDPVAALIETYRRRANEDCEGVVLYEYADERAYFDTRPQREGLTLNQHRALISRAEARLRAEGIDVKLVTISEPGPGVA